MAAVNNFKKSLQIRISSQSTIFQTTISSNKAEIVVIKMPSTESTDYRNDIVPEVKLKVPIL